MAQTKRARRERPTFIEEARRSQIVEAAREIFLKNGFEQSTIAEIAEAIGVSKGVILYHFGNKSDLGKAVIEEILSSYGAHIAEQLGSKKKAVDKLLAFAQVCTQYIEAHEDDFILYIDTLGSFGNIEEKRRYMASANAVQRAYLVKLVDEAKKDGDIAGVNSQTIADAIQAFVDGINSQFCADPANVSPTDAAKFFRNALKETLAR
ncbi:MAG: TetR/AcrR family transcriptional regulator [Maricaulaceae bacterium]